jgi:acyl carrier protein
MTQNGAERIKSLIASILEPRLLSQGIKMTDFQDELDLRDEGIIDSLGFMQLLMELEMRLESEIDLTEMDPEYLTNVGALSRHIAGRHASS